MDSYRTISHNSVGEYKEKGSKFIGYVRPVSSREEFKEFLADVRQEHHKARHHCWAYRINPKNLEERLQDDGEPSGSAGMPIMNQLKSDGLIDVAAIVVRYFGGTKLGIPGLIRSYKAATESALDGSPKIEKPVLDTFKITFDYTIMNAVMDILKWEEVHEVKKALTAEPHVIIGMTPSVRVAVVEKMCKTLMGLPVNYEIETQLEGDHFKIIELI